MQAGNTSGHIMTCYNTYISNVGITTGVFPLIIFMVVGALTDIGQMIANPKAILLGGADIK